MIVNKTTGKILITSHKTYQGLMQAKGLMFSRKKGVVFPFSRPKKVSIHTWFVLYPLDLLFLDAKMKVIERKLNLKPFSSMTSKTEASYLIELPSDLGKDVSIGDIIRFK